MSEQNPTAVKKKTAKKKATAKPAAKSKGFSITTKVDGFRRAGRAWEGTTNVGPDELTAKQIKTLENDPMFVVVKL